jgi:hypothetical protein
VAPSTLRRWQSRHRRGQPIFSPPGPKKLGNIPASELRRQLRDLRHGTKRSHGAGAIHATFSQSLSRREADDLVARLRERDNRKRRRELLHVTWQQPNLCWAIDATWLRSHPEDPGVHAVLARDLASHFHFEPLLLKAENAHANLQWLMGLIDRYGPPMVLKRDNGSPFNTPEIDDLLAARGILPLNSPVCQPSYNGAIEHGIGSFKRELETLIDPGKPIDLQMALPQLVRAVTHLRNARPRRSLRRISPATAYHQHAHYAPTRVERYQIFEWILGHAQAKLETTWETSDHYARAATWRRSVETWLRCQGLISVTRNPKPSPHFEPQKRS